jgi:dnd system-associated protein 4
MRRIQRDACHEEFVKSMTTGDAPIFREIWRLLLFAAALGIKEGKRLPLEKVESGKAMPETYFSTPGWRGFLYLIGIADSGDSECLRSSSETQDNLVTAFEEYANQGLHLLRNRLQVSSSPLDEVVSLMLEAIRPEASQPIVEDLI